MMTIPCATQNAANCLYVSEMQNEHFMNFEWFEWLRVLPKWSVARRLILYMANSSVLQFDVVHAVSISRKIHSTT